MNNTLPFPGSRFLLRTCRQPGLVFRNRLTVKPPKGSNKNKNETGLHTLNLTEKYANRKNNQIETVIFNINYVDLRPGFSSKSFLNFDKALIFNLSGYSSIAHFTPLLTATPGFEFNFTSPPFIPSLLKRNSLPFSFIRKMRALALSDGYVTKKEGPKYRIEDQFIQLLDKLKNWLMLIVIYNRQIKLY